MPQSQPDDPYGVDVHQEWEPLSADARPADESSPTAHVWEQPDYLHASSPGVSDPVQPVYTPTVLPPAGRRYQRSGVRGPHPFAALSFAVGIAFTVFVILAVIGLGLVMGAMVFHPVLFFLIPAAMCTFGRGRRHHHY